MTIPDIDRLPAGTSPTGWAKNLECNVSTIRRAVLKGDLIVSNPGRGRPFITKKSILAWLGLSDEIAVVPPTLRALRKARKAYATKSYRSPVVR
jgi:hypothetical protein